jgi:hypothetical protein
LDGAEVFRKLVRRLLCIDGTLLAFGHADQDAFTRDGRLGATLQGPKTGGRHAGTEQPQSMATGEALARQGEGEWRVIHGAVLAIGCGVLLNYSTLCIDPAKPTPLLHSVVPLR